MLFEFDLEFVFEFEAVRLAFAHDHLNQRGGAENLLRDMVALYPDSPIFVLMYKQGTVEGLFDGKKIITSPLQRNLLAKFRFRAALPFMPAAVESLDFSHYDVVLSSVSGLMKGIVTEPHTMHVCYMHTPARYLWNDKSTQLDPMQNLPGVKQLFTQYQSYLRLWDRLASERVDYFMANSKAVQARIKRYYKRDSQVVYPPVNVDDFEVSSNKKDYFVMVGRIRPYKGHALAIDAFNKTRIPLKIIGRDNEYAKKLKKKAGPNIEFHHDLDDQQKAEMWKHAQAFIFPQEEDFGIVMVESLAAGVPVIAYQKGGALDVIQPGINGEFFPEQTWESLANAVIRFDGSKYNPQTVRETSLPFSVKRFQDEVKQFVEQKWAGWENKRVWE